DESIVRSCPGVSQERGRDRHQGVHRDGARQVAALGLVPRTRSSHHFSAGTVANFGFKSGTRIIDLLVSFSIPKFAQRSRRMLANFGIGTLILARKRRAIDRSASRRRSPWTTWHGPRPSGRPGAVAARRARGSRPWRSACG